MSIKNNKGITLIILVVTIIVLLILAGVTITAGTESIKKAKLETLRTNMLLIRAKGKEYCEEANFRIGTNNPPTEEDLKKGTDYLTNEKQLNSAQSSELPVSGETFDYIAKLEEEDLKRIGLNEVANSSNTGTFYIGFNIKDNQVEVYNSIGYKSTNGTTYYKLSDIENIEE